MPLSALLLALGAATLHAGWNLVLAHREDTQAQTATLVVLAVLVLAVPAALTWHVEARAIPYVAATSLLTIVYFELLTSAYRNADLSVIYPLARGTAPVFVLVVSVLALGVATSVTQAGGVLLVGLGVVLVRGLGAAARPADIARAVALGACTAAGILLDREGVRYAEPIPYFVLELALPALFAAAVVVRARGTAPLRAQLDWRTGVGAVGMAGSYVLVLFALQLAPAGPVAAVRESSVLIAAWLAARLLGERVTRTRVAGSVAVVAGVALVALG